MTAQAIVSLASLNSALALAGRITERRNTLPILTNIALVTVDGRPVIKSTDLDIEATITLDGSADSAFAYTYPAHLLQDTAKKSAGELVAFDMPSGDERATVDFDGKLVLMMGFPIDEFLNLSSLEGERSTWDMPADDLWQALNRVAFAISTEETRYYLNGIFMHQHDDGLRMVATDGHRLARHVAPMPEGWTLHHGVIIPTKAVSVLQRALKPIWQGSGKNKRRVSPETVKVTVNTARIRFDFGNVTILSKLIDANFPDYHRCIPTRNDKRLTVNTADLARLIDRVSTISSERGKAVKLEMADGILQATVNNPDAGTMSDMIECDYTAAPLTIGFNARYVLDILEQVDAETVQFVFDDSGSPTLIRASEDAADLFVLMPLRV